MIGVIWLCLLPIEDLGRSTYMDENAVSPAQVSPTTKSSCTCMDPMSFVSLQTNTRWSWDDVHQADRYLEQLEALVERNASSRERADFVATEFSKLGLSSSTSAYRWTSLYPVRAFLCQGLQDQMFRTRWLTILEWHPQSPSGINAFATLSPPRSSGSKACSYPPTGSR